MIDATELLAKLKNANAHLDAVVETIKVYWILQEFISKDLMATEAERLAALAEMEILRNMDKGKEDLPW